MFVDTENEHLERAGIWEGELAKLYGISYSTDAFAFQLNDNPVWFTEEWPESYKNKIFDK